MKTNLHPNWQECAVTCACGNSFVTRATVATMQVDICNKCHPFFTGEQRYVDKQGRIDKFKQKMATSKQKRAEAEAKQAEKLAKTKAAETPAEKKSFKQMLSQAKRDQEAAEKVALQKEKSNSKKTA